MATAQPLDKNHELVEKSLSEFVSHNIPDTSLDGIDEIVLSYILGVLEDLGSDDGFEVESFIEVMQAYLPGFEDVGSDEICVWIFKLADDLARLKGKENTPPTSSSPLTSPSSAEHNPINNMRNSLTKVDQNQQAVSSHNDQSPSGSTANDEDAMVRQLLEMFPASCSLDAHRCLATAKGQLEDAVLLMLEEMEKIPTVTKDEWNSGKTKQEDKKVRDSILQKYGYVDVKDDAVTHKPVLPKQEKKKMTRYLNSQVCSTKGERFVEIKKPVSEDMKKTFINLKPARSYHFH